MSGAGAAGAVELLIVCASTSHDTTALSELTDHDCESGTALLNSASLVFNAIDCKP